MDNIPITQVESREGPTYMELRPVPITLENCIINNAEDYVYEEQEQQPQVDAATNDYDEGDLSAEEINTMIMINEGKNALK